jgi:PQ loop repeat
LSTLFLSVDKPEIYEIYKLGAVLGISLPFMAIDCLGGVFSILYLIFKQQVDFLADVACVLVVDSWFLLRPPG